MRHLRFALVFTLLVTGSLCRFGYAQGGATSSLSGVVLDTSGAVIPGAEVTAKNDATSAQFKTFTAANGTFSIPALSAGTYTATVTAPIFKQAVIKNIVLEVSVPASTRVTLEVGGSNETVVVLAGGNIVQTATANIATTLDVNQVSNLPLMTRNVLEPRRSFSMPSFTRLLCPRCGSGRSFRNPWRRSSPRLSKRTVKCVSRARRKCGLRSSA